MEATTGVLIQTVIGLIHVAMAGCGYPMNDLAGPPITMVIGVMYAILAGVGYQADVGHQLG